MIPYSFVSFQIQYLIFNNFLPILKFVFFPRGILIAKLAKEKEAAKRKSSSTSKDRHADTDNDDKSFSEKSKNGESTTSGGGIRIRSFAVDPNLKSSLSGPKKIK